MEGIHRKRNVPWHLRKLSWLWIIDMGRLWKWRVTDLAPSHFSFSGLEPDENRDIVYPRSEPVFSTNRGRLSDVGVEKEVKRRTEYDGCIRLVETG
jgi:hypothetical protein